MAETNIRLNDLSGAYEFDIRPDAAVTAEIGARLELLALKKLRLHGTLAPAGSTDWRLTATIGATVAQPCIVTLDPVTTRIDEKIERNYLAKMPELPEAAEVEMPEDDTAEPLPTTLDLMDVLEESLALALPPWPRAEGVEAGDMQVTEPGAEPLDDADLKPFAALKSLKENLEKGEDE